ncbi:hypothetical protein IOQ59_06060 [Pontibacterium sp. N1Y112]|uniref:MSHA biogenesis protein MshK n=1 Tax=Pontibacterium sinense TaxID=2781979 RepID=A0A8J7FT69_9GAMM|nr:hypothetical protein [Pontibacterium sinense]MBE9396825.1 hypothetical protein [Pontibacterium sinense]
MRNLILAGAVVLSMQVSANELPGDPTRPTAYKTVVKTTQVAKRHFTLSYLMVGEKRRVAVVNGQQVVPGSRVDGARVLTITPDGVRLQVGNQRRTLLINKQTGFKKELSDRKRN